MHNKHYKILRHKAICCKQNRLFYLNIILKWQFFKILINLSVFSSMLAIAFVGEKQNCGRQNGNHEWVMENRKLGMGNKE